MKKFIQLLFICTCLASGSFAQVHLYPGGVKGAIKWYATDTGAVKPAFRSFIAGADSVILMGHASPTQLINFHPSLTFKGADSISIRMPDSALRNATFFTVYHSKTPKAESTVWHITKQGAASMVSTTSRIADLDTYQYMNFRDLYPANPKVATYAYQKLADSARVVPYLLKVGSKPVSPQLPVYSFNGLIPEIIVYNRVLTSQERLRVESYLAIKYGVTLSNPNATFLNSTGKAIWDGLAYTNYYHNIAGIARDDSTGLVQPKSTSSNMPGLLTISVNKPMENYTSLVWGDNDKTMSEGEKIPGVPPLLKKKWLMATGNNGQPLLTEVVIDTKDIDAVLPANPVYWLVIDRTGTGDFTLPGTEFKQMNSIDKEGKAHFNDVQWGTKAGYTDVMAFGINKNLLASVSITNPDCGGAANGSMSIKVIGGVAPFKLTVIKGTGEPVSGRNLNTNTTETITNMATGKYVVTVTDALGTKYTDSFYLNDASAPQPLAVAASYALPAGSPLVIKADSLMPQGLFYEWLGPDNFKATGATVSITKPGIYTLKCSNEGCNFFQDVKVTNTPSDQLNDANVSIYPNPSRGAFTARVSLNSPANVQMSVHAGDGRPGGTTQQGTGKANYNFSGKITNSGLYLLEFRSGKSVITKKLIVIN